MVTSDQLYPIFAEMLGLPLEGVVSAKIEFIPQKEVIVDITMYTGEVVDDAYETINRKFTVVERETGEQKE